MKTKLSAQNILQELKQPEYKDVLEEFTNLVYPKNATIYGPGHREDLVFIIKKGRVRVYLAFEDKDFSLAILEKGDIYSTHTRAFVSTLEETEIMTMPTVKFHQFMASYPLFSKTIVSILGELLKQSFSIIDSLVFKDVTQRIVEFLLYEARNHGRQSKDGTLITVDLTMEQLAAVVGSSRQTVSTIFNQLLKAGVFARAGKKELLIGNLEVLKEFPHS